MAEPEIAKMLVLSTAHLTKYACNDWLHANEGPWWEKGDYGWFVYRVEEFGPDDVPVSLLDCIEFAESKGCDWIMFDRDGPTEEGLTSYEW